MQEMLANRNEFLLLGFFGTLVASEGRIETDVVADA